MDGEGRVGRGGGALTRSQRGEVARAFPRVAMGFGSNLLTAIGTLLFFKSVFVEEQQRNSYYFFFTLTLREGEAEKGGVEEKEEESHRSIQREEGGSPTRTECAQSGVTLTVKPPSCAPPAPAVRGRFNFACTDAAA